MLAIDHQINKRHLWMTLEATVVQHMIPGVIRTVYARCWWAIER